MRPAPSSRGQARRGDVFVHAARRSARRRSPAQCAQRLAGAVRARDETNRSTALTGRVAALRSETSTSERRSRAPSRRGKSASRKLRRRVRSGSSSHASMPLMTSPGEAEVKARQKAAVDATSFSVRSRCNEGWPTFAGTLQPVRCTRATEGTSTSVRLAVPNSCSRCAQTRASARRDDQPSTPHRRTRLVGIADPFEVNPASVPKYALRAAACSSSAHRDGPASKLSRKTSHPGSGTDSRRTNDTWISVRPPRSVGQLSISALIALRSVVLASSLTRSLATSATMMRPTSSFTMLKMPRAFMLSVWRWLSSVGVR